MSWAKLLLYVAICVWAYCEENNIPLGPLVWHSLATANLKISNAAWNAAMYSQQKYRHAIEVKYNG